MDIHTTEEQQIEAIKKWWHENKWSLIGGVVIGIAVLLGGRAWLDNKNSYTEAASTVYQVMIQELTQGKFTEANENGKQLLSEFSDTPYAELASLGMAKIKLEEGDLIAAESHLRWALANATQEPVAHEARLRLARVLLAENKLEDARNLLEEVEHGTYASTYEAGLGDIHIAAGRLDMAREAYTRALMELNPGTSGRKLLQMKLDNLGSTNQASTSKGSTK